VIRDYIEDIADLMKEEYITYITEKMKYLRQIIELYGEILI
jgi:hypothetical protein